MSDIIVGKHVLESLSLGMYSNPLDIFREYIQNATDSIDCAYIDGVLSNDAGKISITISNQSKKISILDNGVGISVKLSKKKLNDIGNSDKDYVENRGFRGIGRLGGLGYTDTLYFKTSAKGEDKCTIIKWDCERLKQLLSPNNKEKEDIIGVVREVMSCNYEKEDIDSHYFEVILDGVREEFRELYTDENIDLYLSAVAPVDFDGQRFPYSNSIREYFAKAGYPISTYNITHSQRNKPIYKRYSRSLNTGMQQRTHTKDHVKDIEFVDGYSKDGSPLYIGWLAITDFSGQISDEKLQGIRLRKGNILVGDNTTFSRFFPSEGAVANKMFAGEIHILHPDIIPNTKRDDFEPGNVYQELSLKLTEWAKELNRTYRRGTSANNSAIRTIEKVSSNLDELEKKVSSGIISSDVKREQYLKDISKQEKSLIDAKKKLENVVKKENMTSEIKENIEKKIKQGDSILKKVRQISNEIVNADYATKGDLPTSYSKDERKVYQRIIEVIDRFFTNDLDTANRLRNEIKMELKTKRK